MSPRHRIEFVDTSILVELVNIPNKAERHAEVKAELAERVERRQGLILPTAAVIETGNHIHHIADGRERRRCATVFSGMLDLSARGEAPWVLHDATWDASLIDAIRTGCSTSIDLIEHATRGDKVGLGAGDLSVLAERDSYRESRVDPSVVEVLVWSTDALLASMSEL